MLTSSFIHVRGIGSATEQRVWARGLRDWESFLKRPEDAWLSARTTAR